MLSTRIQSRALVALVLLPLAWSGPRLVAAPPAAAAPSKPKVDLYGDPLPSGAALRLGTVRYRQTPSIGLLAYTPDGKFVITVALNHLQFLDARNGRKDREIELEPGNVDDFALSPDGRTIAVVGFRFEPERNLTIHRIKFIDVASGLVVRGGEWTERGKIIKIGYSPDSKTVAVVSEDATLRLWDATTAVLLKQESLGVNRVMDIDFARDPAKPVMAIGSDHDISIGVIGEPQKNRTITTQNRYFGSTHVSLSLDGSTLAGMMPGEAQSEIQLWRVGDGDRLNSFKLRKNQMPYRMTFSPDGKILALNGNHGLFEAFEVATGKAINSLTAVELANGPLAFSPDGKTLAVVGDRQTLHLWDLETGKDRLATPDAHQGGIGILMFLPDGKTLISGSDDRTVRVWDLETGKPTKTLPHDGWVRSLSISKDGSRLVTASEYPGTVRVWDLKSGKKLHSWDAKRDEANSYFVRGATLDANGSTVIAAVGDGSFQRWDALTGKELSTTKLKLDWIEPNEGPADHMDTSVSRTIFSRDGRTAAMINQVQRMLVVDLASGETSFKDIAHFHACAIAPDGRSLAVGKRGPSKKIPLANGRTRIDGSRATGIIAWLDAQTGRALREIEIPESTVNTLAFSPDGRTIAAGTLPRMKTGMIRIFRLRDMKELQSFEVPCYFVNSLAFTPDGKRLAAGLEDTSIVIWDLKPTE